MIDTVPDNLKALSAYRVFVDELSNHLQSARAALGDLAALDSDERTVLARRFHTIKGGAGFFGLKQLYRLAGELEQCLLQAAPLDGDCARPQELFAAIEAASASVLQDLGTASA